jgi:hypothetical protein
MKKETILTVVVCVLVVVSVVGIPMGYFAGKGEREVVIVASDCEDCADILRAYLEGTPTIVVPPCPQCPDVNLTCPDCPESENCRAWWDLSAPEDYTVWTFDNDTKILNITYYDNWYDIHKNLTFYNWTEIIDWLRFYGVVPDMISARQSIVLMFLASSWGYAETTGNWP